MPLKEVLTDRVTNTVFAMRWRTMLGTAVSVANLVVW